jgi:hypothetical protein
MRQRWHAYFALLLLTPAVASAQNAFWSRIVTPTAPPTRAGGVMVYDSYRQVLVLHGGDGLNDTWEYGGVDWSLRSTAGPSAVGGAGVALAGAYDSQRHVTVLLHGNQNGMET